MIILDLVMNIIFDDCEMIDEIVIFFLVGYEIGVLVLVWVLYFLVENLEWQDRLVYEVNQYLFFNFVLVKNFKFVCVVFCELLWFYLLVVMIVCECCYIEILCDCKVLKGV